MRALSVSQLHKQGEGMKDHKKKTRKSRSRTKTLVAVLASIAILAVAVGTIINSQTARAQQGSSPVESQTDQDASIQYANQKITVDAATGKLRKPTVEEARALVSALTGLTDRSSKGLKVEKGPKGLKKVDLRNRFQSVVLAKPNDDGTSEIRCVTTMKEATEFLGIDPSKIPAKN